MNAIRSKIKLINKKTGTVEVFLSGMTESYAEGVVKTLSKYLDAESSYSFIPEQYIATVDDPKNTQ